MKKYSGNDSPMGTASHIEIHYPRNNHHSPNRKSRKKCIYYHSTSKYCGKLGITCVGPSNVLCKYYREPTPKKKGIVVGALVNSPQHGIGMVMNITTYESIYFEVKYHKNNIVRKYTLKEIKELLLD